MTEDVETAGSLFKAGRLAAATEAAGAAVKKAPTDLGARVLLAELLLAGGNLERADVILDAASEADPASAVVIAEFRQLLRAEMARRQLRRDGRVPEFLGDPGEAERATLAALVALRAGDTAAAAREAATAEAQRPRAAGTLAGRKVDDFRDADDFSAGFFEVLTTTGKYFWIPTERVELLQLHPPKRPRDLIWRRASMSVADGPDGDVYLPATYACEEPAISDALRLGRETEWRDLAPGLVRGIGQRVFLAGDEALGMMELTELSFAGS